jgi:hypothetical protein
MGQNHCTTDARFLCCVYTESFDDWGIIRYGFPMTPESILTLEKIMDYCHAKWEETDRQPPESSWPTADTLTGKKMAYNDVLQYARKLMAEQP